jgi:hypothetical protein
MDGLSYQNPLVPRRLVEVIDRTFRIYRENFIAFIALVALVTVPVTLVTLAVLLLQRQPLKRQHYAGQT